MTLIVLLQILENVSSFHCNMRSSLLSNHNTVGCAERSKADIDLIGNLYLLFISTFYIYA